MANIRKWLEEAERESGEQIEAIVVGQHDKAPDRWSRDRIKPVDEGVILSREVGLAKLDEEYDNGYGGADCYPMYAWTKSWVYFIGEYDGATGPNRVPRNPINCEPQFSGDSQ